MTSSISGTSSRRYVQGEVLHHNEHGKPTVFKATPSFSSKNRSRCSICPDASRTSLHSRRLRVPVDFSPEDHTVVYRYFKDTLLDLMRADPDFPPTVLKKILRHVGEAIQESHTKNWLHLGTLSTAQKMGNKTVTDAALGDFGISYKLETAIPLRTGLTAPGNFMWRSPEGQTGSGMTKASDIFSYGLVCIYALGDGDLLLLEEEKTFAELAAAGIAPHEEILVRHFTYFGPANEGRLKQVDSREHSTLMEASAIAEVAVKNEPEMRFKVWGTELGEAALDMILSEMTQPDPAARPTIDEVLGSSWWQEP
ncbi:hypothetical protein N658DRAFT_517964 [Parathielavia hyrcaniae]|uniref:Protein kinase domain-containing protein n=1 Tax=Parathielavia hyrcaniae TaxID=113614 RepID=A0AAN6PVD9_9PEZI|nr:hypothetical protein N658DRAFT_517964 [Parathielavia hyrcaniae]